MEPNDPAVEIGVEGHVLVVTINHPGSRHAIDLALGWDLVVAAEGARDFTEKRAPVWSRS